MNQLCNNCGHVTLLGHHACLMEGEPVRVLINQHLDTRKTDIYPVLTADMLRGLIQPIDSAHAKPKMMTRQEIHNGGLL